MNDIKLYEKVPVDEFPIRLLTFDSLNFLPHWHEHTEMLYFFGGEGEVICNGKTNILHAGDLVIANQNELHEGISGDCKCGVIMLPPSFFDGNCIIFKNRIHDEEIGEIITKIFEEYEKKDIAYKQAIKAYTYMLISELTRRHAYEILDSKTYLARAKTLNVINAATKYIREHYSEDITIADLSEQLHISVWHFCRLFKEFTGKTPKEYINCVRIEKACDLILGTEMTITEIALCCGFNDINYFSRCFKQHIGMTPTSFGKNINKPKL